jgi:hypothetical protein
VMNRMNTSNIILTCFMTRNFRQNYMKIENFQMRDIKIKTTRLSLRPYFEIQQLSL